MDKKPLILLGAGGHCISCIDVVESTDQWKIEGILDKSFCEGLSVLGYPIIGVDADIEKYQHLGCSFFITVGQIKSSAVRQLLFNLLHSKKALIETIVSPKAHISRYSKIGVGTMIHHFAFVNSAAFIGENCIINSFANIEHEVRIGSHTHISTGVMVNGGAVIGNNCFVGSGSVIANKVYVTDKSVIGAGSLVLSDIKEPGIYVGSPCKRIK